MTKNRAARLSLGPLCLLAAGLLLAQAGGGSAGGGPALVAADPEAGHAYFCRSLPPAGFTLAFDHSMYGGDVRERFVPGPGGALRRVETTTANEAAAEYYAYDARVVREGERFRVDVPPRDLLEVVVRVDRVGRHRLWLGAERLDLVAIVGERRPVRLSLRADGCRA